MNGHCHLCGGECGPGWRYCVGCRPSVVRKLRKSGYLDDVGGLNDEADRRDGAWWWRRRREHLEELD